MRWLAVLFLIWPALAFGQSSTVLQSELSLSVEVDASEATPFKGEMVLITITGTYRRHITRETLVQPSFEGFSWTQLGPDTWRDERLDGQPVKILKRRMAIYPDRAGDLTIGAFRHELTLTDEADEWFQHTITSDPVTITVDPAPATAGWWFPARGLKITDQWSNAPDQLVPGEGVLRMVRIEAFGVTPELLPPMPTLTSPSAMIFPHPEKRLIDLTAQGPVSYAFWRWTIRPTNDTSTIVEPLSFEYFDTTDRVMREVTISAQRVAYGTLTGETVTPRFVPAAADPVRLVGWPAAVLGVMVFGFATGAGLWGRRIIGVQALRRFALFDPLARQLRQAARAGDLSQTRRVSRALIKRDGASETRARLIRQLDRAVFDPARPAFDVTAYVRAFSRNDPRPIG